MRSSSRDTTAARETSSSRPFRHSRNEIGSGNTSDPTRLLQQAFGNTMLQRMLQDKQRNEQAALMAPRRPAGIGLSASIQPKLAISSPGDVYEQEADRVAEAVVSGGKAPIGHVSQGVQPKLFRMQARPEDLTDSMLVLGMEDELNPASMPAATPQMLQRSANGPSESGGANVGFERSLQGAIGRGGDFPASERSFMESRFERDFSCVRVHHDTHADGLARGINARAFTIGNDVFFAKSEYRPGTLEGRRLLAHELTHVVQQTDGRISRQIQRATRCNAYPGYDASISLSTYNCAGLALRTYGYLSPPSTVYNEIAKHFINPQTPSGGSCGPGRVKFWMWQYDLSFEDNTGAAVGSTSPDFHIVAGVTDLTGADPSNVYSKNGRRPVYGTGTGPSFRPPARERATANNASETPLDAPNGGPLYKIRSNITQHITCADCHP
jgi:Domain of unknown function (DUF4157)